MESNAERRSFFGRAGARLRAGLASRAIAALVIALATSVSQAGAQGNWTDVEVNRTADGDLHIAISNLTMLPIKVSNVRSAVTGSPGNACAIKLADELRIGPGETKHLRAERSQIAPCIAMRNGDMRPFPAQNAADAVTSQSDGGPRPVPVLTVTADVERLTARSDVERALSSPEPRNVARMTARFSVLDRR